MRKIFYILLFPLIINCSKNNNSDTVSEEDIYSILNFVISTELPRFSNTPGKSYITESFTNFSLSSQEEYLNNNPDSLFNKKDIEFIHQQMEDAVDFKLNQNFIKSKTVISFDSLLKLRNKGERTWKFWERFSKKYGKHEYFSISKPLFSVDKKTAIVSYGFHCGSLCGEGLTEIYRLVNEKWIRIKTIETWVS
ncbi:hypothetical protein [Flavobacterium lindanitolerans]|uniref:Uncharacterized protein n=1 Tax=Flavobacterium lindanitolerans TaxID=428988 RepID=A0A497TYK6_9FLAO|nr:hypothetical protein [Flavobacterium lindanitolerans]PKW19999.1 hypothetical protein B0G92_3348 [Flavobacterium lindanitolerans]RLJ22962.1 hypothetical protein CLV50_3328 [Flavobacterium lindanitolerans]